MWEEKQASTTFPDTGPLKESLFVLLVDYPVNQNQVWIY